MDAETEQLNYQLSLDAEQVKMSSELFGFLPKELEEFLLGLNATGKINVVAELNKTGDGYPERKIIVDCLGGKRPRLASAATATR